MNLCSLDCLCVLYGESVKIYVLRGVLMYSRTLSWTVFYLERFLSLNLLTLNARANVSPVR
jgi:hypothetical protein